MPESELPDDLDYENEGVDCIRQAHWHEQVHLNTEPRLDCTV